MRPRGLYFACKNLLYSFTVSASVFIAVFISAVFSAALSCDLASYEVLYPCSQLVTSSYSSRRYSMIDVLIIARLQLFNLIINCNVCVCRKDVSHIVVIFLRRPHRVLLFTASAFRTEENTAFT